jgi:8-oxo-dGTP diphosphatase
VRLEGVAVAPGTAEGAVLRLVSPLPDATVDPRIVPTRVLWRLAADSEPPVSCRALLIEAEAVDPGPFRGSPYPVVADIGGDLVRDGEPVRVDGAAGTVEVNGVQEIRVVTSILERPDGRILLLRRSERVGSFRGRWAGVSGYLEEATAEAQAYKEIREETGIDATGLALVARGRKVFARDGDRVFVVHPFRFRVRGSDVQLDWEHTESAWVDPAELSRRDVVPKLERVWRNVSRPEDAGERQL